MDEQRRIRVAKLATAESRAKARFNELGMRNTAHLTPEQREALDVEYRLAQAEWRDALDALEAEIGPTPSPTSSEPSLFERVFGKSHGGY
jgi:hypothetical protein